MPRMSDLVAEWEVELSDKKHLIQFEHGTLTGKRIVWVDGNEMLRRDFVFDLVGSESFTLLGNKFVILISANALDYQYTLTINDVDVEKFVKQQLKTLRTWIFKRGPKNYRIALEKDTLDIWVNGTKVETHGEFIDNGTETHFTIEPDMVAYIKATNSGKRSTGIIHSLFVNSQEIN